MKEKDIYRKMKEVYGQFVFLQRIETSTGLGIPDIAYCITAERTGWIEIKIIKRFPNSGILKVPFRPGQFGWITNYRRYSQNVFLFLYVENTLFIFKGDNISQQYSMTEIEHMCHYRNFWNKVEWIEVLNLL